MKAADPPDHRRRLGDPRARAPCGGDAAELVSGELVEEGQEQRLPADERPAPDPTEIGSKFAARSRRVAGRKIDRYPRRSGPIAAPVMCSSYQHRVAVALVAWGPTR